MQFQYYELVMSEYSNCGILYIYNIVIREMLLCLNSCSINATPMSESHYILGAFPDAALCLRFNIYNQVRRCCQVQESTLPSPSIVQRPHIVQTHRPVGLTFLRYRILDP